MTTTNWVKVGLDLGIKGRGDLGSAAEPDLERPLSPPPFFAPMTWVDYYVTFPPASPSSQIIEREFHASLGMVMSVVLILVGMASVAWPAR